MNRCTECKILRLADDTSIPCFTAGQGRGNINHCPFCGAPRITPQQGDYIRCRSKCTGYECGSEFVVNYAYQEFAAIYSISPSCKALSIQTEEDII